MRACLQVCSLVLLSASLAAGVEAPRVSPNKWFDGVKGYREALELQAATGMDIFLYFAQYYPSDQKGRCRWLEKRGLGHPTVGKYLRDYLKVKILLPLDRDDEEALARFQVKTCPAVFIVQTNGWRMRCPVFTYENRDLELKEPDELVELFRLNSGDRYREASTKTGP